MTPTNPQHVHRRGSCSARGDYDYHCTEQAGHRYAHYDATEDVSWTDRSEDHRDDCTCDVCEPEAIEPTSSLPGALS